MAEQPRTVGELTDLLRQGGYLADRGLATALFLAMSLPRPILLEGEVGVGKTEAAKVLAGVFGRRLIRLQCYEGIDTHQALYEWDYARQMLQIRALSERQIATGHLVLRQSADLQHLPGVVPLIQRLVGVDAFVTLQPDELAPEDAGEHLGRLGLAHPDLAFEQDRARQ